MPRLQTCQARHGSPRHRCTAAKMFLQIKCVVHATVKELFALTVRLPGVQAANKKLKRFTSQGRKSVSDWYHQSFRVWN